MTRRLHIELPARARPALVVALVFSVAACGSSTESADSNTPRSTAPSTPASSASGTNSRQFREYPGGGPTDPVVPPGVPTYSLISSPAGCRQLLNDTTSWKAIGVPDAEGVDTTPLYMSAAFACLGRWDDATRVFAQINTTSPDFRKSQCARNALLHWLAALIRERRQNPNFSPVFVPASGGSPCPADESPTTVAEPSTSVEEPPTTTTVLSTTTPSS